MNAIREMAIPNVDSETGIHYGAISIHSVYAEAWENAAPVYPETVEVECPECKLPQDCGPVNDDDDLLCEACGAGIFEDARITWDLTGPEAWDLSDPSHAIEYSETLACLFVTKSKWYTYCRPCSPCAPNAGDLDCPDPGGLKTCCLLHTWFDGDRAPYPVFRVEDNSPVPPPTDDEEVPA